MNTDETRDAAIVSFIPWFYVTDLWILITHSVYFLQGVRTQAVLSETYVKERTFIVITSKTAEKISIRLTSRNKNLTTVIEMINLFNRQSGNILKLGIAKRRRILLLRPLLDRLYLSHPSWVCGLKLDRYFKTNNGEMSHPSWVCGLKLISISLLSAQLSHTLRGCVD